MQPKVKQLSRQYQMQKNGLKIFNHEYNESNGGSSRYYITHNDNKEIIINQKNINKALNYENKFKLDSVSTYSTFKKNIQKIKEKCNKEIKSIPKLSNIPLIKQSRLSVMPLTKNEWETIIKISEK